MRIVSTKVAVIGSTQFMERINAIAPQIHDIAIVCRNIKNDVAHLRQTSH